MIGYFLPKRPIARLHVCERISHGYENSVHLLDELGRVMAEVDITGHGSTGITGLLKGEPVLFHDSADGTKKVLPVFDSLADEVWLIRDCGTLITVAEVRRITDSST